MTVDLPASNHRLQHLRLVHFLQWDPEDIPVDNHKVRKLVRLN